ncbi:Coiled-coil domain-containing protein 58 [Mortierella sp. 14UC]|nr:Coiled-coil domain-containing protein 58 [Mortierella sp. 14UC]
MPAIAETTCYNLSKFRATMKSFRVLDDNIMLRLNETNTLAEAACANFFNELVAAYQKRDASIKFCLETMDKNIAVKKEKLYQDPDDYTLKDSIMTDESKARIYIRQIIANESVVEDIVRGRSLKAFQEKCALFDLPDNIQEFLDKRHG